LPSDFKFGGFGSDHISRTALVRVAVRRACNQIKLDDNKQICQIGDAPRDMRAARKAGATPIGATTGRFSAAESESADAYQVVLDLIFF